MKTETLRRWLGRLGTVGVVGGLILVGAVALGRVGPGEPPAGPRAEATAVAVTVEPVTPRPVQRTVTVVGSLYGRDEVTISPKVEGRIVAIRHDVGDAVKPGDVLLEIDPTDYQLAVAEARRALELELAKIGLKELPAGRFDVTRLPTVVRAAALEKNAAARHNRLAGVRAGTTAEEREQAQAESEVARANHQQAILEAEATLASARHKQAALAMAEQRLRDTKVVVPGGEGAEFGTELVGAGGAKPQAAVEAVEYVVAQRSVSEGEIVRTMMPGESATLFRLVIDRPLKLQATVPERHRGEVKVGQAAELEVEAYPGETFAGTVARVNPTVDRASRTFQVEVHVPNADRRLSPGSFAKVTVRTRVDPAARTVPEEALVAFAGVTKVFTVRDGRAVAVPVRPGVSLAAADGGRTRTWVEVEGDLPAGAPVVTAGQTKLADGTAVRVR